MNVQHKKHLNIWLKLLRSGRYKQTPGVLRAKGEGYCCLGVACEAYRITTGRGSWLKQKTGISEFTIGPTGYWGYLPTAVAEWLGVDSDPILETGPAEREFASILNDRGWSFRRIADSIEATYLSKP